MTEKEFWEKEIRDNPGHPTNVYSERELARLRREERMYVTNPAHGGKVICHECGGYITITEHEGYWDHQHRDEFPKYHFHKGCFKRYKHYYGIDQPID